MMDFYLRIFKFFNKLSNYFYMKYKIALRKKQFKERTR